VGYRAAERTLVLCPLHVYMDPLVVAGHVGELVDESLGDVHLWPPGTELLGSLGVQSFEIVKLDGIFGVCCHDGDSTR
jgi:hypothetical protein